MKPQRFDELFNKVYEGDSLDSTEGVELVDELDSALQTISKLNRLNVKLQLDYQELRRQLAIGEAKSA